MPIPNPTSILTKTLRFAFVATTILIPTATRCGCPELLDDPTDSDSDCDSMCPELLDDATDSDSDCNSVCPELRDDETDSDSTACSELFESDTASDSATDTSACDETFVAAVSDCDSAAVEQAAKLQAECRALYEDDSWRQLCVVPDLTIGQKYTRDAAIFAFEARRDTRDRHDPTRIAHEARHAESQREYDRQWLRSKCKARQQEMRVTAEVASLNRQRMIADLPDFAESDEESVEFQSIDETTADVPGSMNTLTSVDPATDSFDADPRAVFQSTPREVYLF